MSGESRLAATLLGILDNLSGAVSLVDSDLRYLYINKTLAGWYARPIEQVLGKSFEEILSPETVADLRGILARVLSGETLSHEGALTYPDGRRRWVKIDYVPQLDAAGRVWGFVSLLNDMSARHEAELALRRSEERLKRAQRIGNVGSWEIDLATGEGTWSDFTYQIFGLQPAGSTPRDMAASMIDPPDKLAADAALAALIKTGQPYSRDYRITRADGARRILHEEAEVQRDAVGQALRVFGSVQDVTELRLKEGALRENQFLLEIGERLANMGSFEWDVPSGQIKWSKQMWTIHGLPQRPQAPMNDDYIKMIVPDDRAKFSAICRQIESTGAPYEVDFRIVRPDGEERTLHETGFAILDSEGRPIRAFGSTQDVTELERGKEILRRERAFADLLIDAAPAIVLLLSPDGKVQRVNRHFEELTGYRQEEIVGRDWADTFIPSPLRPRIRHFIATVGDEPVGDKVNPILTKDGTQLQIEWADKVIRDSTGRVISQLAVGRDITERLQMEESLRASEARLRQAQAIARIGTWEISFPSLAMWCSDEIYHIYERKPGEFSPSYELFLGSIHPEDREMVETAYSNSLMGHAPYHVVHRINLHNGGMKWVEQRCQTEFDADGHPIRSMGTMQDITELKNVEDELRRLAQESVRLAQLAEQANRAKSEFLATMSHELRTPLNAIIGFSEALLYFNETVDTEKKRDYLSLIAQSGQHLLTLINDILDLAKVESGQLELRIEKFALHELAAECTNYLSMPASKRGISIRFDVPPITIVSDRRVLKQLLINLLSNAVKFNRDGGWISITASQDLAHTVIIVEDTGIGMTKAEIDRALQPFVQIESTYQRTREGTGLGLTLVQRFTSLLGGTMQIGSVKGVGTRIVIELPHGVAARNQPHLSKMTH